MITTVTLGLIIAIIAATVFLLLMTRERNYNPAWRVTEGTKPIPDYKRIRALEEELGFAKPGDNQFILEATPRPKPSPRRFGSAGYGNPGFGNPWDTPRRYMITCEGKD